ncbi:hypothetical protein BCR42DRAFT_422305 [Absidia repens]|uniref:Uncharacterized protein n=1 Tax=Absidia repens TaxID=90262 RepID=A0A1X2I6C5_9FUNG|nr:hypothetical protein BCR42DRAFT_422305 [Absidia repens]
MSSKLARQALDQLLKSNDSNKKIAKKPQADKVKRLPDTKSGIKKAKYEIRYGQQKRWKLEREEQKKKENPIDDLVLKEEEDRKKLERTISLLSSRWGATSTERSIHQKTLARQQKKR